MRRPAAVAGTFYPADPETLRSELERYLQSEQPPQPALACVVPHAGIMYSGSVAGAVYARLALPSTAIILAPNHRRWGAPLAVMTEGEWETPLGAVPIATGLARALRQACPALVEDAEAHRFEHSLEVQLPFLQRRRRDLHFVPVGVGEDDYGALEALGRGVATVVREADPKPLIVASTDLNHYDPDPINRVKDRKVIEPILALDPRALYERVHGERITMCGYGPTVAALVAARELGAREAELVRYATSGDVPPHDRSRVVGYAGIIVR